LRFAVLALYLDLFGLDEAAHPGEDLDLVLPHQALHTLLQPPDDPVPVFGNLVVVEFEAVGVYPKLFAMIEGIEQFGGVE
jgi:hypothetical protein